MQVIVKCVNGEHIRRFTGIYSVEIQFILCDETELPGFLRFKQAHKIMLEVRIFYITSYDRRIFSENVGRVAALDSKQVKSRLVESSRNLRLDER